MISGRDRGITLSWFGWSGCAPQPDTGSGRTGECHEDACVARTCVPGDLGIFLGKTASSRKRGIFIRHLCLSNPEGVADPRSLAAIDAADLYEAGEIDEPVYQARCRRQCGLRRRQSPASGLRRRQRPASGRRTPLRRFSRPRPTEQ